MVFTVQMRPKARNDDDECGKEGEEEAGRKGGERKVKSGDCEVCFAMPESVGLYRGKIELNTIKARGKKKAKSLQQKN